MRVGLLERNTTQKQQQKKQPNEVGKTNHLSRLISLAAARVEAEIKLPSSSRTLRGDLEGEKKLHSRELSENGKQ